MNAAHSKATFTSAKASADATSAPAAKGRKKKAAGVTSSPRAKTTHATSHTQRHVSGEDFTDFDATTRLFGPGPSGPRPSRYHRGVVSLAHLEQEASVCTRCPLAAGRTNVVFGVGDAKADLMFVGEGPGRDEDLKGEPFVGRSGHLLDRVLQEELGISRDRVYISNTVKCRPPGNRDPHPAEVAACRPYLERQIDLIGPRVIVTLGNFATRLLLDSTQGIKQLRGRAYPYKQVSGGQVMVVPTFHPSFVLRSGGAGEAMAGLRADLVRAKQHLGGAPR